MPRSLRLLTLALLALTAAACGSDDDAQPPRPTASATASATRPPATPTATASASATVPSTATRTAVPETATPTPTATTQPATATPLVGAIAHFTAETMDLFNPFPSDRLLDESGHVAVTGALFAAGVPADARYDQLRTYLDTSAASLNQLTGFSTWAPIRVTFDAPIAAAPAPQGGVLLFKAVPPYDLHPIDVAGLSAGSAGAEVLEIQPHTPLEPRTRYVYVVTTAVRDAGGAPVRIDPDLRAALAGDVPALAGWRAALAPVLAHLDVDYGIAADEIAAIDSFTTQPIADDLLSIVGLFTDGTLAPAEPTFSDSPIPGLITGIFPEGSADFTRLVGRPTSATLSAVAVGSFASYDFRYGRQRAFDPAKLSGEVVPSTNELDFYMTIPKDPAPPEGYPIIIYGHGLTLNGQNVIGAAQALGERSAIMIGISAVEHGRRGSFLDFFNFDDGLATRENFRQTVADQLQVARMIEAATVPPFDQVDKRRIHYSGLSLGGIMGAIFMAYDPAVQVGMLSVPGGGLAGIIRSELIGSLLQPKLQAGTGVAADDPFYPALLHNFINIAQWLIDAGDPINTAPHVLGIDRPTLPGVPPKRILIHEGQRDTVVPNVTTENLARAMGLADVKASSGCADEDGCSGIWRYAMTEYGEAEDSGHFITLVVPQAIAQATRYVDSDGTEILDAAP